MSGSRFPKTALLILGASMILLAGCATSPTQSATESASPTATGGKLQMSLLAVPFTVAVPVADSGALRAAPVSGDWIDQMGPIAATQLTYTGVDGKPVFLANAFWFDTAQLNKILDPNEPPPGTTMATVGDRSLVVAVTVEMPYEVASADAKVYGALSELFREKDSYSQFGCPVVGDEPVRQVSQGVRDVVFAYFQGKDLLPMSIDGDQESVLDVQAQLAGTHSCFNEGSSGEAGYVAAVPADAVDAVRVYVKHKAYAATGATATFVTLAKVGSSWSIVAEGTGP